MATLDQARASLARRRDARRLYATPDLFGEIPVTWPEVYAWCEVVARFDLATASPRRVARYIADWNVIGKVRAAKERGDFHEIIEGRA